MAIEKIINIKVNSSDAEKNLNKTKDSINDVTDSTNNASKASAGLFGALDKMTGGAISKMKAFKSSLGGVALGFKGIGTAIALSGLGLLVITIAAVAAAFKGSEEGQNKFAKLMGVIGSITGNLIDLLADFGETVISVFESPLESLKALGDAIEENITNRIKGLWELLPSLGTAVKQVFSGDFAEAGATATNAVSKVVLGVDDLTGKIDGAKDATLDYMKQVNREAKEAAKVADQRAEADKIERDLIVAKALAERDIADLRLKAKDLNNVSAAERKAALLQVLDIQDNLITQETKLLELRRDAQIAENTFARSDKENLNKEENAKAAVIAAETRRTDQKRQIQRELTAAENELAAQRKAQSNAYLAKLAEEKKAEDERLKQIQKLKDESIKIELERLKTISDFEKDLVKQDEDYYAQTEEEKLELKRERAQNELDSLVASESEKREAQRLLNEYYDQLELDLEIKRYEEKEALRRKDLKAEEKRLDDEAKAKKALETSKLNMTKGTLGNISEALDASSTEGKAFAAAQALVNTYQGVTAELATKTVTPFEFGLKLANIAATTAIGFKSVKDILSTNPTGVSGAGSSPASGISAPSAPSFNLVSGTGTNQIAESIAGDKQPIKAYVVSGEMSTQQALDRNIQGNASI